MLFLSAKGFEKGKGIASEIFNFLRNKLVYNLQI